MERIVWTTVMIVSGLLHVLAADDDVALAEDANNTTVAVKVGQRAVVRLKGNITTGYSWQLVGVEGKAVRQVGKIEYVADQPIRTGSGGVFVATFRSAAAGTATVKLAYARPWEKGKPPEKTFTVTLQCTR